MAAQVSLRQSRSSCCPWIQSDCLSIRQVVLLCGEGYASDTEPRVLGGRTSPPRLPERLEINGRGRVLLTESGRPGPVRTNLPGSIGLSEGGHERA